MAGGQSVSCNWTETIAAGGPAATLRRMKTAVIAIGVAVPLIGNPGLARATMWPDQAVERPEPAPTPPAVHKQVATPSRRAVLSRRLGRSAPAGHSKLANAPQADAKPHGPLIIAISIEKQHLRIYDANGLFAESPVSTGMPGHPTPMGVFSVIQKSRLHHSNIYSGAPMPYMQRITWSGVAMHAGVLPGHPASHGCIRMPMAFAIKLWGWSKLGARVIVAPGDIAPAEISHPALMTHAAPARPTAPPAPETPIAGAAKAEKVDVAAAPASDPNGPQAERQNLPLEQAPLRPSISDRVRLADATADLPATSSSRSDTAIDSAIAAGAAVPDRGASSEPKPTAAIPASPDHRAETAPGETAAISPSEAPAHPEGANAPAHPAAPDRAEATAQGASPDKDTAPPAKDQSRTAEGPREVMPKTNAPADMAAAGPPQRDVATAPSEPAPAAVKRSGHIAVLISRKEARLYVRQNFEPWFDVPVTIARSDQPLGTHVFTARADASDPASYHWSVVSLPQLPKRHDAVDDPRSRHKRPMAAAESEPSAPPAAADILDRLKIPDDAVAKIAAALTPGGSIIVSDHGLGGETGLGTDFIIPLR